MAEEQETWLESLTNPLIGLAILAVEGTLSPQHAFAAAKDHNDLRGLTDGRLAALLEEVDRYWRSLAGDLDNNPMNLVIYPSLMVACAEARLEAIARLWEATAGDDRVALDCRLAGWLAVMARCLMVQGLSLLLVPEPSRAGRCFSAAYHRAGQQPDRGSIRLYELLGACRGVSVAAGMIGQTDMVLDAECELARLARTPGREFEALDHLVALDRDFIALLANIFRRQVQQSAQPAANVPPPPKSSPQLQYRDHLRHYAEQATSGKLSAAAAAQALRRDATGIRVDSKTVYFASFEILNLLADSAPDRATIFAELNAAVARDLTTPLAELTRGYCAYALGYSLERRATLWRREHPDELGPASPYVNALRQAASHLEEALRILSEQDVAGTGQTANKVNIAGAAMSLLRCHGQLCNTARALEVGHEAADRLAALEESPAKWINLGVVLGNIGEVLEAVGELDASFEHNYRAFKHFLSTRT